MLPRRRPLDAAAVLLAGVLLGAGCAGRRPPDLTPIDLPLPADEAAPAAPETTPAPPATEEPPQPPVEAPPAPEAAPAAPEPAAGTTPAPPPERPRLRDLCRNPAPEDMPLIDDSRRMLEQTFCGATLWFDGLFGGEPDVDNARAASGRVELSALYSEFDELDYSARLRLNYELPTLERRLKLFLGRDAEDDFVQDRPEGFAVRSSVFGLETEDRWLAGLGYSPPGRWFRKLDLRVGGRVKSAPEVFVQSRYRHNVFVGDKMVWRLRETVFWENRDGWGSTTSVDWDRVLQRDLLLRWGASGTYSETTQGVYWRSAALLYRNLQKARAAAAEVFVRGSSGAEVKMSEYGTRLVYRQPAGRPYLFGEIILGYTWPRYERDQPRDGSAMLGFGIELLFGRDPF